MTNVAINTWPAAMLGPHRCCNIFHGLHRMGGVIVIHGAVGCTAVVHLQRCGLQCRLSIDNLRWNAVNHTGKDTIIDTKAFNYQTGCINVYS